MNFIRNRNFRAGPQTSLEGVICHQNSDKQQKIKVFGRSGGVNYIKKTWHYLRYKQLGNKMNIHVAPFTVGPGFRFFHYGDFIHIGENAKVGANFTVNQGVVLDAVKNIVIGNHVTLCPGVKVVKDVVIGNNVVVGTMSVVTHNIPDNAVAAGSPARVLHIKKIK